MVGLDRTDGYLVRGRSLAGRGPAWVIGGVQSASVAKVRAGRQRGSRTDTATRATSPAIDRSPRCIGADATARPTQPTNNPVF